MKKKLDYKYLIIGMLAVALITIVVLFILSKSTSKKEAEALQATINDKDWEITQLNNELRALGETQTVYRTKRDVKSGDICDVNDLEQVEVPVAMANGYCTVLEDIIGKHYIIDVPKGTPITEKNVYYTDLKTDDRYLDIICDREPIGFKKGDTVDIRVSCPDGQDYLLLERKLVHSVYGNVVNILADEKDIIIYKGMEADWCRFYKGAEIGKAMMVYCVTHVQGGIQTADRYYPIANVLPDGVTFEGSVLWTALNDSNLKDAELDDWVKADRATFEKSLEMYDQYRRVDYTYAIRTVYTDSIGTEDYEKSFNKLKALMHIDGADEILEESGVILGANEIGYVMQCSEDDDYKAKIESTYNVTVLGAQVYDKTVAVDMIKGSAAVAKAKSYRDKIYGAAHDAYVEQQQKIAAARAVAELEGIPFDEETWEFTYALYQKKMEMDDEDGKNMEEGVVY